MNDEEAKIIQEVPLSRKRKTTFAGDVLILTTGTTIAQEIAILFAPFLTIIVLPVQTKMNRNLRCISLQ